MKKTNVIFLVLALTVAVNAQTTKQEQASLTPDEVIADLMEGNARFVSGKINEPNTKSRLETSASGQYPKAVVLSCLDSRVPVEQVFDQGIGDIFVGRVAGNIENEDQLGSMEFATKLAGAKLVLVLGHTSCGAVKGAADGAQLGNLTALLAKIKPAVDAVEGFEPERRNSSNLEFLNRVIEENVRRTIADIRSGSEVLAELESSGQIKIMGGIYDLKTGKVTLLN